MNLSDTFVVRSADGSIKDYVFIDPSRLLRYHKPGRDGFELAVSFSVESELDRNYPVVFDDLTTSDGDRLERIDYAAVPPAIKRKLVAWLKVQPQPAAGPAGVPANLLSTSTSNVGTKSPGSDGIKDELVRAHPETRAADWKRCTRNKKRDGVHRRFEHADGRIVDTVEKSDGTIEIVPGSTGAGACLDEVVMNWPDAEHVNVEIFVAGPRVDELAPQFEEYKDNPDLVALFRNTDLHDEAGRYNGDGCDRLEMDCGVLWAGVDGISSRYVAQIVEDCVICARRNCDLSYMVVGFHPVDDDEIQRCDVLFLKGFDAGTNPMRRKHGRFYAEYVVRGI